VGPRCLDPRLRGHDWDGGEPELNDRKVDYFLWLGLQPDE
jgi:hypothetical protein